MKIDELRKICSKCGIKKSLQEFNKQKTGFLGVKSTCKICRKAEHKTYHEIHKKRINNYHKIYYQLHKKEISVYQKAWYATNKNKRKLSIQAWKRANKIKINTACNRRRKASLKVRLNHSLSTGILLSLKDNKNGYHWENLVGYTIEKLKKHLEKQFTEGMTWENYGIDGWAIDHKIPKSIFNFTKPEHRDFKRCWALSNLQPMWAKDNLEKSAKITEHFQPSLLI